MFIFRRINEKSWGHIWKSVSLLVIQMAIRVGSSIILKQRRSLLVKGLTLMNDTLMALFQNLEILERVHIFRSIHQDQLLKMMEMNKSL